ncbi:MAG: hypothetical protein IIU39_07265 [Ruminococcus sp.]|nr:hypothetical protein [Ruminococcus sp.]
MIKKRIIPFVLIIAVLIAVYSSVSVNAEDYPVAVPYTSHITSTVGKNIEVKLKLFHEYYDERIFVDVYDSKRKSVASATDYFDEDDADEQIYTFTWLAKKAPAGEYTLLATMSYYYDGEWQLCPEDVSVAITLKNVPAPKLKSAKNVKGGKITAKWSKVNKASKYQLKIGSKTYSVKKNSYTAKKLKKGKTYAVKVRACMNNRWSKWSSSKKVKVSK